MKKRGVIILLICIFIAAAGVVFLRIHNGKMIKPSETPIADVGITPYRQDDPAWAVDHLGSSEYTMKSSGCLVSCIASAVSGGGEKITPGELNALLSENGGYDEKGNLQWYRLAELDGFAVKVYDEVSDEDIEQCLSEGRYPIVRVRVGGVGSYHYVLIVGKDDGEYLCMDPLKDELARLSAYGDIVYAVRCVWRENIF